MMINLRTLTVSLILSFVVITFNVFLYSIPLLAAPPVPVERTFEIFTPPPDPDLETLSGMAPNQAGFDRIIFREDVEAPPPDPLTEPPSDEPDFDRTFFRDVPLPAPPPDP